MSSIKIGDTIQCYDQEEMLEIHNEFMVLGIYTDWLNIKAKDHSKYKLTVVGFDEDYKNEHV